MTVSRREILIGMAAGAAASVVGARTGVVTGVVRSAFGIGQHKQLDLGAVTADTFRPHIGTTFRLRRDGRSVPLTLSSVDAAPPHNDGKTSSFSLHFDAPAGTRVGQDTYPLHHHDLGSFDLFLVPSKDGGAGTVVNHLVRQP